MSSIFLFVNKSTPQTWILAEPCLPGFETAVSITLHGFPLSMQYDPFLMDPPWIGWQSEVPDSIVVNYS